NERGRGGSRFVSVSRRMITRVCPYSVHRGGKGATIYCKYVNYINYTIALGYYGAEAYDISMTFSSVPLTFPRSGVGSASTPDQPALDGSVPCSFLDCGHAEAQGAVPALRREQVAV